MVGQAFSFDGVDDRLQVTDNDDLKLTKSLSIEGWVRVNGFPSIDHGEILFRGDDRNGLDPYSLSTEPNGTVNFHIDSGNGTADISAPIPLGKFIYVAATLDDATGAMRLYLNGTLATETTTSFRPFRDLDPGSNPSIGIGNHGGYPATDHNFPFNGLIDELSVYDRALTPAQIQSIFNAGTLGKDFENQPPAGTSGTVATLVNTNYTLNAADFGFSDPNGNALQAVEFTLLPNAGVLKDNGTPVTTGQFVTAADIDSGRLVFSPNQNLIGGPFFLAKFQVQDDGGTSLGGQDLDPNAKILSIQISRFNHAPTGTSGTVTMQAGNPYKFKTADFGFQDPNDSPPNYLLAVKITLLPNAGTLTVNGQPVSAGQLISVTDISSGRFTFTPRSDIGAGQYFLFKFQVQDNGGTVAGGTDFDPNAKVLDVNLKVSHAPIGRSATVSTHRNTTFTFTTSTFGYSDPNDIPPDTFQAVKITLLPNAGIIQDNGIGVTAGQFVSVADIAAGKLVFIPHPNLSGGPFFLCKFQVRDDGNIANGGVNLDPIEKVLKIMIQ
nr:hypothetical protein Hi04_10k_c5016_00045 [uncultured bacterium]